MDADAAERAVAMIGTWCGYGLQSLIDMAFAYKANGRKGRILNLVSVAVQCVLAATAREKFESSASRLHCGKSER